MIEIPLFFYITAASNVVLLRYVFPCDVGTDGISSKRWRSLQIKKKTDNNALSVTLSGPSVYSTILIGIRNTSLSITSGWECHCIKLCCLRLSKNQYVWFIITKLILTDS